MNDYNDEEKSKYLMYLDVNGLYGWTMCETLPISDYEWLVDFSLNEILLTSDDSEYGFLLEVDLEYPTKLHDLHNDYPMCAEKMCIGSSKQTKLILNLNSKEKYVLHYRTLKLVLSHGLVLKYVHRVLRFKQTKWLKPFIDLNNEKRLASKNPFEKNYYKLTNNSIYGKALEDVKKRSDIKLVNKWHTRYGAKALICRPNFKGIKIFNENLVAIELNKISVKIDKPMIVGIAILELSKVLMYSFHYEFMLEEYGYEKCKLAYTDTDSFIYCIEDEDVYKFIQNNPEKFNDKTSGLMKDENAGHIMTEFIGLRAKMYSYRVQEGKRLSTKSKEKKFKHKESHRAKGVKKHIIKNKLQFNDFLKCIEENAAFAGSQPLIKSSYHKVYSITQNKIFLESSDDKRYILSDKKSTLAWGHYKCPQSSQKVLNKSIPSIIKQI